MLLKEFIKKLIFNFKFLTRLFNSSFIIYLLYLIYKRVQVLRKKATKKVVFKPTKENINLISCMEPLDFIPSFFFPSYLTQAGYHEYKQPQKSYFNREYIYNSNDGGLISIDWFNNPVSSDTHKKKLLIIIHGLTGGSESLYIRDIADGFYASYTVATIHARGINDTPLITPYIYTAGSTDDVRIAINHIRKNYKYKYAFLMGISMGANISYKLLANDRSFDDYLLGYISISNFFNQLASVVKNTGSITDYFLHKLRVNYCVKHRDILAANKDLDIDDVINSKSLKAMDVPIATKMFNFKSVEDYYRSTESGPDIDKLVNIKTLILVAKDDPIVLLFSEDYQKSKYFYYNNNYLVRESENIILIRTEYGGHIGWFEGISPNRWFVNKCFNFCEALYRTKIKESLNDLINNDKETSIFEKLKEDFLYGPYIDTRIPVMGIFD